MATQTQSPSTTIRAIYEHIAARNIPAVLDILDPRIDWIAPDSLPYGGTYHGHEGFQRYLAHALTHLDDDFQVVPDRVLADGEDVVVTGTLSGRARATGKPIDAPFVHLWTLDGGRATHMRYVIDTATVLDALAA
jgi:uncharacterized protein